MLGLRNVSRHNTCLLELAPQPVPLKQCDLCQGASRVPGKRRAGCLALPETVGWHVH